jgi:monofunctional biosynthetic peptidoglycan transglycosylase
MKRQIVTALTLSIALVGHAPVHASAQEDIMSTETDSTRTLFRFDNPKSADRWVTINDNVMGGISDGAVAITNDSCLLFRGSLSLENNGGFASIRALSTETNLSGYEGIRIRVQGDGRTYQLRLRVDTDMDGIAYKREFRTVADAWVEIDLPFESFQPSYRGRILRDAKTLMAADIRQVGFLIADKIEGEFRLLVDEVSAYK